ncbi:MAG TPA: FAD-dependent oxidoreductase [bacterium]|nr:FAD-dependent oxidoreductase [bacterium]
MNEHANVVVLGAGYAGLVAAMRLARQTDTRIVITLVNASDVFHERVRNHQLAAGQALRRLPVASFLRGTRIRFLQGRVTAVEPARRRVAVQTADHVASVEYDYLVYALGSYIGTEGVPGAREHASTLDDASARALADRVPGVAANRGRLLVVGGGNTGVEVATELAEAYRGLQITLVTRRSFARQLSPAARAHVRSAFDRLGVQFVPNTAVTEVHARGALTEHHETIPFDLCVWVGGFAVSDLARRAGLRVNERGQILVDRAMRSLSHPEIYAVGDAAHPADDPGAPVRMSLYTATAMGAHGADCLAAELAGKPGAAFGLSYGALGLSLGRHDGVVQFLDAHRDTPSRLIVTGALANQVREFFVRLSVWVIKGQRLGPWTFYWPGKKKMRGVAVPAPRPSVPAAVATASTARTDH